MSIEEIYKNINEWDITRENVLDFLFQEPANDSCKLYYRCMLLQLLENFEHFDYIIDMYHRSRQDKSLNDTVKNAYPYLSKEEESIKIKQEFYSRFERGDLEEFKGIIEWAQTIIKELENQNITDWDERIATPSTELAHIRNDAEEIRNRLRNRNYGRLDRSFSGIDNSSLHSLKLLENDKYNELKDMYYELGLETVWKSSAYSYDYYDKKLPFGWIMFWNKYGLFTIIDKFSRFKEDLYMSSKLIQNQADVLTAMENGSSLGEVCNVIRTTMHNINPKLKLDIRDEEMYGGFNRFLDDNSTPPEQLPEAFKKLEQEYEKAMHEQDPEKFVRLCANFHFNFLKVHPFADGNGRTSRLLLSSMLASRNIFLPSMYAEYNDKEGLYTRSNEALTGDYKQIQSDLFLRLGRFQPTILPPDTILPKDDGR